MLENQWHSIWRRLKKDPMVMLSLWVLGLLYLSIAIAGFLAPYSPEWHNQTFANAPPTPIHWIDEASGWPTCPYVKAQKRVVENYEMQFVDQENPERFPVQLFVAGESYKLFGFLESRLHFFGVSSPAELHLLGTDLNGRDNFSRLLYGGQISLTIGFLSLLIAFPLGMLYGGISGYFGGWVDTLMMRGAEIMMSIPSLYLLISLAAILPPGMPSTTRFTLVVVLLALIGWAGLARVIRGMVLSIKNQDFIEAERALGLGAFPLIIRHILPQTMSYVIVAITIGVPGYILAESGLSFLGLGIQQPDASWGNMLKEAQELTNLLYRPWMLTPGFLIFMAVLAFNILGDALRDILDPKSYKSA